METRHDNLQLNKMTHGGDRYRHQVKYDFSINVNPLGIPDGVKESLVYAMAELEYYPDLHYQKLREALADRYDLSVGQVVCGNGASELLMGLIHAYKPENVLLPVPSFSGYRWCLQAGNAEVFCYYDGKWLKNNHQSGADTKNSGKLIDLDERVLEYITKDTDFLFLTNPGNPAGRYIDKKLLLKICDRCKKTGTMILLDECFMELSDEPEVNSMISYLKDYPNLLILRAFTKSFAIPGIRLGYLLCDSEEIISRVEKHLPEWNISMFAQEAGCAALKEKKYLPDSREYIKKERAYLSEELEKLGFNVEESVTNFLLFHDNLADLETTDKANILDNMETAKMQKDSLYEFLLKEGILIRDCSDYPGIASATYRIAVRTHKENVLLLESMKMWKKSRLR